MEYDTIMKLDEHITMDNFQKHNVKLKKQIKN